MTFLRVLRIFWILRSAFLAAALSLRWLRVGLVAGALWGLVLEGLRGFVLRVLVGFVADGLLLDGFVGVWLGRDETGLDGAVSGLVVAAGLGVGSKEMLTVVPKPMRELTLTRPRLKSAQSGLERVVPESVMAIASWLTTILISPLTERLSAELRCFSRSALMASGSSTVCVVSEKSRLSETLPFSARGRYLL